MIRVVVPFLSAALLAGCPVPVRYADCGEGSVELASDPTSCGGCHRACPQGAACVLGECRIPEGTSLCHALVEPVDENASVPDPTTRAAWAGGEGSWAHSYETRVRAFVTDLSADPANCGRCGVACPEGSTCLEGVCVCESTFTLCEHPPREERRPAPDGIDEGWWTRYQSSAPIVRACVDLTIDPANCGRCGIECPSEGTCLDGECVADRSK